MSVRIKEDEEGNKEDVEANVVLGTSLQDTMSGVADQWDYDLTLIIHSWAKKNISKPAAFQHQYLKYSLLVLVNISS